MKTTLEIIEERIADACLRAGRPRHDVQMVAVTKTVSAELIREAWRLGLRCFAENYIQEALRKQDELTDLAIDWHFIGHLQSNKAKDVVGRFSLLHSLGTLSAARELSQRALQKNLKQRVLIEINIGGEVSKPGVSLTQAHDFYSELTGLEGLQICGVMTMPPPHGNETQSRKYFSAVREWGVQRDLKIFSMGSSDDFEWAILEGATHIRLGTILFGVRPSRNAR